MKRDEEKSVNRIVDIGLALVAVGILALWFISPARAGNDGPPITPPGLNRGGGAGGAGGAGGLGGAGGSASAGAVSGAVSGSQTGAIDASSAITIQEAPSSANVQTGNTRMFALGTAASSNPTTCHTPILSGLIVWESWTCAVRQRAELLVGLGLPHAARQVACQDHVMREGIIAVYGKDACVAPVHSFSQDPHGSRQSWAW